MSTIAFRGTLVREIEQVMKCIDVDVIPLDGYDEGFVAGKLDAYAHILLLLKDEDL